MAFCRRTKWGRNRYSPTCLRLRCVTCVSPTTGAFVRLLPLRNVAAGTFECRHAFGVEFDELTPLAGDIRIVKDRLHGTLRHARLTIDATLGIDVELHLILIEA